MVQNFFLDATDREAIQVLADAHRQNSLPGKGVVLKLLKPSLGIILSYSEANLRELKFSTLENFVSPLSASITKLVSPAPQT